MTIAESKPQRENSKTEYLLTSNIEAETSKLRNANKIGDKICQRSYLTRFRTLYSLKGSGALPKGNKPYGAAQTVILTQYYCRSLYNADVATINFNGLASVHSVNWKIFHPNDVAYWLPVQMAESARTENWNELFQKHVWPHVGSLPSLLPVTCLYNSQGRLDVHVKVIPPRHQNKLS